MEDAVGKEEILLDDARLVDEERVIRERDGQVATLDAADRGFVVDVCAAAAAHARKTVGEVGGVVRGGVRGDYVVFEEGGEVLDGVGGEGGADGLEREVRWGENGEVGGIIGIVA